MLVPVLFEIAFVAVLAVMLLQSMHELDRLERANRVLLGLNRIETLLACGTASLVRGNAPAPKQIRQIDELLTVLNPHSYKALGAEYAPELEETLSDVVDMRDSTLQVLTRLRKVIADPSITPNMRQKYFGQNELLTLFMSCNTMSQRVVDLETRVRTAEPKELEQLRLTMGLLLFSGITVSSAITFVLARVVTLDIMKRLEIISENAQAIAASRELAPPVEGTDEIAQLDRVLHQSSQLLNEANRKEAVILANAVDIICSLDAKLRFQAISAAVSKVWNYDPADLLGQSALSLLKVDTADATRQALQRIAEGPFEGSLENIVKCSDGSQKNSLWTVRWSPADRAYYCVIHDVTELRAIEDLKKQFLSMVSHDLRTPLMSIGLSIDLMTSGKRGPITEKVAGMLNKTKTSLSRLIELVNQLLELQKLEAGKMQLDLKCVSASDVCAAARESLESMAANARVQIKGPIGDAALLADEGRLVQVMTNLISNAIKFSPADSIITLSLVAAPGLADGDFVRVNVADQGPGIAETQRALLFEKFTQSSARSNISIKGTGLGLAITKAIIEAHDGEVGVDSEIGKGSTFWIKIRKFADDSEGDL